jgi:hypothetical protein
LAALTKAFDPTQHDTEQNDFELLPNGTMRLEVSASDIKEEDGNKALNITIDVIEPVEYAKRRFFAWMDLEHREADKQERGQKDFAKLCRAIWGAEVPIVEDTEQLHFLPFVARVKKGEAGVSKAGRAYKARNSIQKYFYPDEGPLPEPAIDEVQPATKAAAANNNQRPAANQNAPAAKPAATGNRPWAKK